MTDRSKLVSFHPLDIATDVTMLYDWLIDEDVSRWYDEGEHSLENYRIRFSPEPTTNKYIFAINGNPAGYLQAYRLSDEPDYAAQIGLEQDAVGTDLFIGNPEYRNAGWGAHVLIAALTDIVFGEMQADLALIAPDPENLRAVKCYLNVGFHGDRVVWINDDEPGNTGNERIMLLSRAEFVERYGSSPGSTKILSNG